MITRRKALLLGGSLVSSLASHGFASGEFWNEKHPHDWSEKEVQRLLTKSPWAKEVNAELNFAGGGPEGGPGGMPGAPRGGRMGSGMGGPPPMGGPGVEGPPGSRQIKTVIRWETAAPIREAVKQGLPRDPTGSYVISVSGLPGMGPPGAAPAMPGRNAPDEDDPMLTLNARLRETTSLQRKGRESVAPIHIEPWGRDRALLFYFPNDVDPISADDKEVVYQTRLGPLELKARFTPKEMRSRGKPAI